MKSAEALSQIESVRTECIDLLGQVDSFCPPDANGVRPEIFRLIAVPIIYSVWERAFRVTTAVALRYVIERAPQIGSLSEAQRALLLLKEPFYKSYSDKRLSAKDSQTPGKGDFDNLSKMLSSLDSWSKLRPKIEADAEEYVMTFSNVDEKVLRLHERILETGETVDIASGAPMDISLLGQLLGRRNEISHGGSMQAPGDKSLNELFSFTENLIQSYCETMRVAIHKATIAGRLKLRVRTVMKQTKLAKLTSSRRVKQIPKPT